VLYINNENTNPYHNLALEEYLLKNFTQEIFILWQNAPSVIVGRNQNTLSEINVDYIKEQNVSVVRRLTGGGAVFHDLGNLNYTFVVNDSEGSVFDFEKHTAPIIEVLQKLSVDARFSGRNDLTIDGKKFSGNAQYRYRGRLLHHGTLLFNSSISDIFSALKVDSSKFEGNGIRSVESRVTNISEHLKKPLTLPEFKQLITAQIKSSHKEFVFYDLTKQDLANVGKLEKEKYATWEWNYGRSPEYNFSNRKKFVAGSIEAILSVNSGIICDVRLYGDFFGEYDISEIENALKGKKHEESAVRQCLSTFDMSHYFSGISSDEFISLMF
jgi:lipoate-protein ligase A